MSVLAQLPRRLAPAALRALQVALVLLILWLLAGWFWALFTPTAPVPAPAPRTDAAAAAAQITTAHPFGAGAVPAGGGQAEPASAAASSIVLRGVIAAKGRKRAVAIVSVNGGEPLVVTEGDAIGTGATLDRVYSDRIDVRTAGGRQRIELAR